MFSSSLIPFCRQGHGQITIEHQIREEDDVYKQQILVFGGKGINYKQPDIIFLDDLWILKIVETPTTLVNINKYEHEIVETFIPSLRYYSAATNEVGQYRFGGYSESDLASSPFFEWRQIDQQSDDVWPRRRWSFAYSSFTIDCDLLPFLQSRTSNDDIMKSRVKMLIFGGESDYSSGLYGNEESFDGKRSEGGAEAGDTRYLSDLWMLVNESLWLRLYDQED
jgi:hypothetical protein